MWTTAKLQSQKPRVTVYNRDTRRTVTGEIRNTNKTDAYVEFHDGLDIYGSRWTLADICRALNTDTPIIY